MSAVTHFQAATTPIAVNHQGQFPSVTLSFNLAPGVALGDADTEINKMQQEIGLPASIRGGFSGTAQAFQASLSGELFLIIIALLAVYIVLGVLYESYIHPITILSTLPSAGLGAVLALMLCHSDLSIIALIGIILLIGIVKKNAILMIDFALEAERHDGKSSSEAIFQACLLRFRPILMTTMAAMLGAMPLVVGLGTGSELRRPLGIAIVGGLVVSQVLTLYTTPVVYLYLDRVAVRWRRLHGKSVQRGPAGGSSKHMNRKFSIIAVSLAAFALLAGGCNFAPKYQKPSVETPEAFKEAADWKPAQPKDDARRGNWWEIFGDPQLNALEEQVSVSNQNIAAAFANFLAARAAVKEARANYYPVLATAPSATRSYQSGALPPSAPSTTSSTWTLYSLPIDASWEPDLWGNIRNNVNASTFAAQASAATLEGLLLSSQADLAADYYQLRAQDMLIQVFVSTVAADQKSLDLLKVQRASGIASDEDVSQAETLLKTAQAQATGLGIARAQLEHAIALLVGKPASSFSIPVEPFKASPPAIPLGIPSQLLERRPDIAASERNVAAANERIGIAKAAFFPKLTLTGSAGLESGDPIGNLIKRPIGVWSIGGGLAETIFDAGLRSAVVEQSRAEYDATVANYRQTVLTAFQEVEDSLSALRILSQQVGQQDDAVHSAERTLALATHRYELGIDSYLNVIAAQIALLNNQQTAVSLRSQQMTSSVRLIVALGGGWNAAQLPTPEQLTGKAPENAGSTR